MAYGFLRELGARGHDAARGRRGRRPARSAAAPGCICTCSAGPRSRARRRAWGSCGGCGGCGASWAARAASTSSTSSTRSTSACRLALADAPVPVVLGPYVPDWPPSGPGAEAPARSRRGRASSARLRAAQQRRATTVLLSTPAAAAKLARPAGPAPAGPRRRRPASTRRPGRPARRPARTARTSSFLANLEPAQGRPRGCSTPSPAWPRRGPARGCWSPATGPQEAEVRRRVAADPALARVRAPRPRSTATRRARRSADCAVLCVPSFGEPFGMTVLEAMACARPVVATDAGGPAHLVTDGGGRRVPPGDPAALAARPGGGPGRPRPAGGDGRPQPRASSRSATRGRASSTASRPPTPTRWPTRGRRSGGDAGGSAASRRRRLTRRDRRPARYSYASAMPPRNHRITPWLP